MIIFNASLPRAGSTLLSNILGNNPDIYASPTSSLMSMVTSAHAGWNLDNATITEGIDLNNNLHTEKREESVKEFFRKGMEAYYNEITQRKYKVDKSRGWLITSDLIGEVFPESTMLCMIRHPYDIMASFEKIYRNTPMINKIAEGTLNLETGKGLTVEARVQNWLQTEPFSTALDYLIHARQIGANNIQIIKYEDLIQSPDEVMKEIYTKVGIPYYKHNFKNIKQVTHEVDIESIYGQHKIRPEVKFRPDESTMFPLKQAEKILGVKACLMIEQYPLIGDFMDEFGYQRMSKHLAYVKGEDFNSR